VKDLKKQGYTQAGVWFKKFSVFRFGSSEVVVVQQEGVDIDLLKRLADIIVPFTKMVITRAISCSKSAVPSILIFHGRFARFSWTPVPLAHKEQTAKSLQQG
jgi:hypothetical protein